MQYIFSFTSSFKAYPETGMETSRLFCQRFNKIGKLVLKPVTAGAFFHPWA